MDLLWGTWSDNYDDSFLALCAEDTKATGVATFSWHRYLQDNTNDLCTSYAAFVAAFTAGPIESDKVVAGVGESEILDSEEDQTKKEKLRKDILAARRKL